MYNFELTYGFDSIEYSNWMKLLDRRIEELSSFFKVQNISDFDNSNEIMKKLDRIGYGNKQFFALSVFAEGLKNTGKVVSSEGASFILFVLSTIFYENYLISPKESAYKDFMFFYVNPNFDGEYEKFYILHKFPYELNSKIKKISLIEKVNLENIANDQSNKLRAFEVEMNSKIENERNKADELINFIKSIETKANFVGLSKAFFTLIEKKKSVRNWQIFLLGLFGFALLGIPFLIISGYMNGIMLHFGAITSFVSDANGIQNKSEIVIDPFIRFSISLVAMELLLIYFFRIVYQQYLYVSSELLQLNLRHSLCAFIENYIHFKKDNNDVSVDLFEKLVFSNIMSDTKEVPATFDCLEGISKIINGCKGK